jgi:NAD(P)H-flavin reductase
MLSPSVRGLRFVAEDRLVEYRAGQSIDLLVPTRRGLVMRRPYSIASAPDRAGALELAVTRVEGGPTSTALHELACGAIVEAVGPSRGWLARRDDEREAPLLLVATGSGLAPFRALLQEELQRLGGPPVALIFGCRTQADILWREELEQWATNVPRFSLTTTLSRPDGQWRGASGWVQRHVVGVARTIDPALVLLCGLSPMTDAIERLLGEAGVPASRMRVEAYDR